jgi:hypothetical protein
MDHRMKRLLGIGFLLACGAAYHFLVRPRLRFWGTTPLEAHGPLPGDEMYDFPILSTHAINIEARREAVWPWLVQLGEGRGGFYSHDWIERLMFGGRYLEGHSATRIHPELQDIRIGDKIRLAEPEFSALPVTVLEPPDHFALGEGWHFLLQEMPGGTRLIVRERGDGWLKQLSHHPVPRSICAAIDYVFGDPLHFLMETGMLRGIKKRAEAAAREEDKANTSRG